mmetsp:Transcript_16739/g.31709  ORF Transcript_16739/g.31709 Transcript_16739/m.31709 type:complete len:724 (-) Transcript_16739:1645-3816(-)
MINIQSRHNSNSTSTTKFNSQHNIVLLVLVLVMVAVVVSYATHKTTTALVVYHTSYVMGFGPTPLVSTRTPRTAQMMHDHDRNFFCKKQQMHRHDEEGCSSMIGRTATRRYHHHSKRRWCSNDPGIPEGDEKKEEKGGDKDDWRSFRAHLVSNERNIMDQCETSTIMKSKKRSTSSWIHDSGLLECGTILLNNPALSKNDVNKYRYALTEQWLHKSVLLVLECCEQSQMVVNGILLNRPTDLILYDKNHVSSSSHDDEEQYGGQIMESQSHTGWEVWFGGDEFGIHSEHPKFFCLHSISDSSEALALSNEVIPGIYFCSLQDARGLVSSDISKKITSDDFWVFCGFQTWNRQELEEEMSKGLWYSVATDASLVEKGHRILKSAAAGGARSDGDRTWKILMRLIGHRFHQSSRDEDSDVRDINGSSSFSDKMLNEWCLNKLEFDEPPPFLQRQQDRVRETRARSSQLLQQPAEYIHPIKAGTLIQASFDCSRKLMTNQQFHCSTILILQDDDDMTVGVIINMPSQIGMDLWINSDSGSLFDKEIVSLPLRCGGPLGGPCYEDYCEDQPLFTFHLSSALRERNIGEPIGEERNGIWKCSYEDLLYSIKNGIAFVEDFAVVDGICVWQKVEDEFGNVDGGLMKEIQDGNFNIIDPSKLEEVWKCLSSMEVLKDDNIDKNLSIIFDAWEKGRHDNTKICNHETNMKGLYDEALKHWMELYLIGKITD